jgi:predicted Zn finger-like uncharacterized protein
MKFVCDRCQTRYSIADEKVRQKILRIRCKTCGNVIVVQDERIAAAAASSSSSLPKVAPASPRSATLAPGSIPASKPAASSAPAANPAAAGKPLPQPGSVKPTASPTPKPPSAPAPKASPAVPPPPPSADLADALGGRAEWYLAAGGVRSGPFSRVEASRRILAADHGKVVHVWKDGMNGWKPAEEVSVIARELSLLRSPPPPPPPVTDAAKSSAPKVPPVATSAQAVTPAAAFPGKALDALADGTTERMDIDAGSDSGPFRDNTTKKGADLQAVPDEVGGFTDITTKKGKNIRKLVRETEEGSAVSHVAPIASSSSSASLPAPIPTPLPVARSAAAASAAAAPATTSSGPGGLAGVMLAVAEPQSDAVAPEGAPELLAPPPPSLVAVPAEAEKPRRGTKYLLAAGIIIVLVLLIALVSFRMDSHKVPVEPELPQSKAVVEPTVAIEEPKPAELEPQAVVPVVDERPTPAPRGGKRSTVKTVKQVGPAPIPLRASTSSERPVPKLAGGAGADSRPNPFDESRTVSQSQISAVVRNKMNQAALKACYERALKMDNHLTSGRIDVTVSIGMSGMVQHVVVNAPSSFILVEPCIKTAVRRWVFPPSSEEYATNFPLIMQGGM